MKHQAYEKRQNRHSGSIDDPYRDIASYTIPARRICCFWVLEFGEQVSFSSWPSSAVVPLDTFARAFYSRLMDLRRPKIIIQLLNTMTKQNQYFVCLPLAGTFGPRGATLHSANTGNQRFLRGLLPYQVGFR
jgi:hypothetical protein